MLEHIVVGTNTLDDAKYFYDRILGIIGMKRSFEVDNGFGWALNQESSAFIVVNPFNSSAATCGNGNMVAFKAEDKILVDRMHRNAIELGGNDEGAPGERSLGFYGAYFRDLDDNKICICHIDLKIDETR